MPIKKTIDKESKESKEAPSTMRKPSVYLYFSKIQMPEFKKNNAELKHKDVMTKLGATWKALSDSEKTEYEFLFFKKTPSVSLSRFLSGGRPEWLPKFPLRASIAHLSPLSLILHPIA